MWKILSFILCWKIESHVVSEGYLSKLKPNELRLQIGSQNFFFSSMFASYSFVFHILRMVNVLLKNGHTCKFLKYYRGRPYKVLTLWYGQINMKSSRKNATSVHRIKNREHTAKNSIKIKSSICLFITRSSLSWQSQHRWIDGIKRKLY